MRKLQIISTLLLFLAEVAASFPGLSMAGQIVAAERPFHTPNSENQESPSFSPLKSVELLVLETGGPGPVRLEFRIELEPGWHLYWENPGDAGLAPAVRWKLPEGFVAGPLLHPVPKKSVDEGLVTYVHSGTVLLICDIAPSPSDQAGRRWEADAVLEWMACRESCIVGETAVRTVFPPAAESIRKARSLFEADRPLFPRPLSESGLTAAAAEAEWTGAAWRIKITLAGPRVSQADDFYPYPLKDYVIEHAGVSCHNGKIVLPVVPSRGSGSPPPVEVGGLVILGGTGYDVKVHVVPK